MQELAERLEEVEVELGGLTEKEITQANRSITKFFNSMIESTMGLTVKRGGNNSSSLYYISGFERYEKYNIEVGNLFVDDECLIVLDDPCDSHNS